jgi:putative transposase
MLKKEDFAVKQKRFTVEQIVAVLKQAEAGVPLAEVLRRVGVSEQTFYRWKKQYVGLEADQVRQLKQLQEENQRLKQVVADLTLDKAMLQDVLAKNVWSAARLQGKSERDEVVRENVFGLQGSRAPGHDENPRVPVLNKFHDLEDRFFDQVSSTPLGLFRHSSALLCRPGVKAHFRYLQSI